VIFVYQNILCMHAIIQILAVQLACVSWIEYGA